MAKHFGDDADSEAPKLLLLLSRAGSIRRRVIRSRSTSDRVFECKTCSKTFPTFQALGGHRTGHKRQLEENDAAASPAPAPKKAAHECPVCGLVFPLGQALGGHMRRHKDILAAANNNNSSKNNNNNNNNNNGNSNNYISNCDREEYEDAAPADSTGASDLLSGCSSDARHDGDGRVDDLKATTGSAIGMAISRFNTPTLDAFRFVDLELRLGLHAAPPPPPPTTVPRAYGDTFLTALRLGIQS